jgi:PAS domain S-box-containing protein
VKGLNVADWDAQWGRERLQERLRELVGGSAVFETRHRCKDGSIFDVEVCLTSVRIGGEQLFFCVTRDITERKHAEERLRRSEEKFKTLFGIAPVGISVLDRQRNIIDANPSLEKITRLSKEELLNGTYRRRTYLNADGTPKPANEFPSARAVAENRSINDDETGIVTENGEIIWTQVSVAPLALPDASAVVITQDITERKRAEEALKTSYDQLRAISARLQSVREEEATRIAREIHDELGQKLTGLKMDLRRAERKIEELESSPALNTVLDTIVSATELVDEIVATVQEIAADLRPGVLDKLGLGSALQYEARRFRERTGILCEVRLPESEPTFSTEVSTTLFRIFQECLTNITRHAHATKVEASLKLEDEPAGTEREHGGWVILRVQDNGRGITPMAMTSSRSLGLLGMKERAALLGGEILFERGPEGGTDVTVRIAQTGVAAQSYEPV